MESSRCALYAMRCDACGLRGMHLRQRVRLSYRLLFCGAAVLRCYISHFPHCGPTSSHGILRRALRAAAAQYTYGRQVNGSAGRHALRPHGFDGGLQRLRRDCSRGSDKAQTNPSQRCGCRRRPGRGCYRAVDRRSERKNRCSADYCTIAYPSQPSALGCVLHVAAPTHTAAAYPLRRR